MSITIDVIIPIVGWSSNVTMAERAVEEYASNGAAAATTSDLVSFLNGINGGLIPTPTLGTEAARQVRFQQPVQQTDVLSLEIRRIVDGKWYPYTAVGLMRTHYGSYWTGIAIDPEANSTDILLYFSAAGVRQTGTTFNSSVGNETWTSLANSYDRYRVRKVSSGAAVGFPVGAANVVGRTDGLAPAAGYIGEQIRAVQLSNTAFPATGAYGDLASISLPAGVWDISAVLYAAINTAGGLNVVQCGISSTVGNSATGLNIGDNLSAGLPPTGTADTNVCIPQFRVVISATTIYYLKYLAAFSSGSPNARGRISAVRVA
jgi:hypothetical protein